jgi:hypothetical protein
MNWIPRHEKWFWWIVLKVMSIFSNLDNSFKHINNKMWLCKTFVGELCCFLHKCYHTTLFLSNGVTFAYISFSFSRVIKIQLSTFSKRNINEKYGMEWSCVLFICKYNTILQVWMFDFQITLPLKQLNYFSQK